MHIQGPTHVHGAQPISAPHRAAQAAPPDARLSNDPVDRLEISPQADLVSRVREIPDIRTDKVASIKAQIEAGTYETADKLEGAVDKLLAEMLGQ